jgi:site-specific recombinase XerD
MANSLNYSKNFPETYPMNFSGKLTYKIIIKDDYIRTDGTCALFIQLFLNKQRKRIPLHISCKIEDFDKKKQRLISKAIFSKDFNLIIEKALGDINKIEVNYRLSNTALTFEKLLQDYENPSSRLDFCKFWEVEMEHQKEILKPTTYRQQMSVLAKLKKYKNEVFFYEIDLDFVEKMKAHFKNKLKNEQNTINSFVKSFKKYLSIANDRGITTPILGSKIIRSNFTSDRTFLMPEEIQKLNKYFHSEFINATHKAILSRFLFSCFTGLRISDIQKLTVDNFADELLFFTAEKTGKIQKIRLNNSALSFIDPDVIFFGNFTGEYINRELKFIAKVCGIRKNISFHVSRHTFATNYLLSGGDVVNLQKLLAHSKITDTMTYVHIVESITNVQILSMDDILKAKN